jgi:lipoprotein-anchoring transpeptidase ErfK/SrfK
MQTAFRSLFAACVLIAVATSAHAACAPQPRIAQAAQQGAHQSAPIAKPAEAAEVVNAGEIVEGRKPAEATEVSKPESTEAAKPLEAAEAVKQLETLETAKQPEAAEAVKAPETTEAPKSSEQGAALEAEEKPSQPRFEANKYEAGTIVVETSERKLHLVLGNGEVLTYPVGVGKAGKAWKGNGMIRGKYIAPAWSPPAAVRREKPWLPDYIPGGTARNPMGAAAMLLNVDQYAIHGTNDPSSIGGFVSFGCIRMHNKDILDLYSRVHVGTRVVVLQ